MAYVYRHIRLDKNVPFYIGIGKSDLNYNRASSNKNRNPYWHHIVNQTEYVCPLYDVLSNSCLPNEGGN